MGERDKGARYRALPALRATIRAQGRHQGFLARALRLSESHMSRIVNGKYPIDDLGAHVLATLLGVDLDVLFELPDGSESVPESAETGHAEPAGAAS